MTMERSSKLLSVHEAVRRAPFVDPMRRSSIWRRSVPRAPSPTSAFWCVHFLLSGVQRFSYLSQVYFALTDATQWPTGGEHEGANLNEMFNFIVDYFEDTRSTAAERRARELLRWWNKYVVSCSHLLLSGY